MSTGRFNSIRIDMLLDLANIDVYTFFLKDEDPFL